MQAVPFANKKAQHSRPSPPDRATKGQDRLLYTLAGHRGGRPEAFRRESKTFGELAILRGVTDETLDQAQGRLQMLITLGIAAFAKILRAFIRELENTVEEISLSCAAIAGKVLAHDQNKGVGSL
jgi:hypothetical protein